MYLLLGLGAGVALFLFLRKKEEQGEIVVVPTLEPIPEPTPEPTQEPEAQAPEVPPEPSLPPANTSSTVGKIGKAALWTVGILTPIVVGGYTYYVLDKKNAARVVREHREILKRGIRI